MRRHSSRSKRLLENGCAAATEHSRHTAKERIFIRFPKRGQTHLLPKPENASDPFSYLPTIRIVNEPGTTVPWGARPPRPLSGGVAGAAGAGPRSWLIVKMWFVLLSNVMVRAPFMVFRFCSTSKLVGLFSFTTVNVPLPCALCW